MPHDLRSERDPALGAEDAADLLARAREHDALAFEHFYDAYHSLVYGIAFRLLSDVSAAEDLTQSVFLKFWSHPEAFPGGDCSAWLARVTRARAVDLIESTVAHPEHCLFTENDDPCVGVPLDAAQSARMKSRIFAAMRSQAETPRSIPSDPAASGSERARQFAYALAAIATLLALLTTLRDTALHDRLAVDAERIALLHERIGEETHAAAERNALIADLFSGEGRHYAVTGGQIVTRADRLYLVMRKLPKLPAGHVFQAWTRERGSKELLPTLTFTPDGQGMAIVQLPIDTSRVAAIAVSVEPEGGSKTPTTRPLFDERLH